ncbi:MAG: dephospho-CoA kinase [Rickettsiales bacterium]|nr:dephospho-CoA kinase [Rickettsiales bacterium]
MTKVIGITGLIASGKSVLADYLKSKGFKVFDADCESKKLYMNIDFLNKIKQIFPNSFKGEVFDKNYLRNLIFSDKNEKSKLENLIHPILERKCEEFIKENINEKVIFLDIPLLFEVKWDKKCSDVILVIVDKQIQLQRFLERGGDIKIFDKIIENQGNIEEKISKSKYVLYNDYSLKEFYDEIEEILNKL